MKHRGFVAHGQILNRGPNPLAKTRHRQIAQLVRVISGRAFRVLPFREEAFLGGFGGRLLQENFENLELSKFNLLILGEGIFHHI